MNYHDILHDDMRNGDGLRVVLFVSGCDHYCDECQNPQTWDSQSGIVFDASAKDEIFTELCKDHIAGITFSGGDPLNEHNLNDVLELIYDIRNKFEDTKTIWIYSGYSFDEIMGQLNKSDINKKRSEISESFLFYLESLPSNISFRLFTLFAIFFTTFLISSMTTKFSSVKV